MVALLSFSGGLQMIRHLNPVTFQGFGTILPEKQQKVTYGNHHSLPLSPDTASLFQTVTDTWLSFESGLTILSVYESDGSCADFYLDKPVLLRSGVRFALTAFQGSSSVQMAGLSLPRLLQTQTAVNSFLIHQQLQVDCLYTFFYHEKEQGFLFSGESHPMIELTYVDQGSLHSVADGQDLLLQQGDMVLYGPDQWHMQYADIGVAPRYVTVSFTVPDCDLRELYNRKFKSPQRAISLLQQMLREQERTDPYASDMILSLLTMLLITLLREADNPNDRLQSTHCINNENDIISRAQQYISSHVRDKLSVPVVAHAINVSTSYLTALFHKHLQLSPGEYIRRIKLQESKQMIREGNMNFTEIAMTLQYSTIHHFSRQFKEKFGITPSEYAKSVR